MTKEEIKKQKKKEYDKQRYLKNKERIAKRMKKYCAKNKEKIAKRMKKYCAKNKEKIAEQRKEYCLEHKEEITKQSKEYSQTSNGKASIKASNHNRRVLKKGLTVAIVKQVYEDNLGRYGTLTCELCGGVIKFGQDSVDHKTPLSKGGTNLYGNLQIAHIICNDRKGTKTMEEWTKIKVGGYFG